jgi:hypothetical protein
VGEPEGLPGRGPPWLDTKNFSLVPILNRYARRSLTIINSKFHRISNFCRKSTVSCRSMLPLPNLPRIVGRQNNRNNVPARTPEEYCRRAVFLQILHSSFHKFSVGYAPTSMAGGEYNRITPSIIFFNLNLQLEGVCTSNYKSSRHKI